MQLFVLGMHRSGTSAITRILNLAGSYFGPEGMSNGADEGNPKGFWERVDVRAACDGLLQGSGFDWWRVSSFSLGAVPDEVQDRFVKQVKKILLELDAHRPWVVKEPRLSLLFPLLRPSLELPVCIHVTREPLEVAESLHVRNGLPRHAGLALWELYEIKAFESSTGLPRIVIRYEDLLAEPVETVSRLVRQLQDLGTHGLRIPSDREITAFITPELHRQRRPAALRTMWMNDQQLRLAALIDDDTVLDEHAVPREVSEGAVDALREFEEDRDRRSRVIELEGTVDDLHETVDGFDETVDGLNMTVDGLNKTVDNLNKTVDGLHETADDLQRRFERDLRAEQRHRQRALGQLRQAERAVRQAKRSRALRLAWSVTSIRRIGESARPHSPIGPLDKVLGGLERAQRELGLDGAGGSDPNDPDMDGGGKDGSEQGGSGQGRGTRGCSSQVDQ